MGRKRKKKYRKNKGFGSSIIGGALDTAKNIGKGTGDMIKAMMP